jgi:hypothetical protein
MTDFIEFVGPTDPTDARLEHSHKLHQFEIGYSGAFVFVHKCRRAGGKIAVIDPKSEAAHRLMQMRLGKAIRFRETERI